MDRYAPTLNRGSVDEMELQFVLASRSCIARKVNLLITFLGIEIDRDRAIGKFAICARTST